MSMKAMEAVERRTGFDTRISERFDRKHERDAHEKRLWERKSAAYALFAVRTSRDAAEALFWIRSFERHEEEAAFWAVHDMRRR